MRKRRHRKPPGALNLPRVNWEGGCGYYAQFAKAKAAGWSAAGWFPFAVFLSPTQSPHPANALLAGVNFYEGIEHNTPLSLVTNTGMHAHPHMEEWTTTDVGSDAKAVGWFTVDEVDMDLGGTIGDENARLAYIEDLVATAQARADGRFTSANIGNGVLNTFWCPNTIDEIVRCPDICGVDQYAYTSYGVQSNILDSGDWPGGDPECSAAYGWLADQMRAYHVGFVQKPVFVTVEVANPCTLITDGDTITANQFEGAIWAALLHEARGIMLYQHNVDPTFDNYSLTAAAETTNRATCAAVTAKIRLLAPVLNTQTQTFDFGATGVHTMLKQYQGHIYIFANMALGGTTGSKTFTLPRNVRGKTVTVISESRTLPVSARTFTDTFSNEYTHHVYKVAV